MAISEVNQCLEQAQSDSLSSKQKLEIIHQSQILAKKASIDSIILKNYTKEAVLYNYAFTDSALTVLKSFEKLAMAQKDTLYIAHSYLNLGKYYFYLKQNNTALT